MGIFARRKKEAAKQQILHDISTPLTNIMLELEELVNNKNIGQLEETISELQAIFAQLNNRDSQTWQREIFLPEQVIAQTLRTFRKPYGVICHFNKQTDGHKKIFGSANDFSRITVNILNNAAEAYHVNDTDREIFVELHQLRSGYQLLITDHGQGMSPWVAYLADKKHFSLKAQPSGLGLFQVKTLLRQRFGGQLNIYSRAGLGTTVSVFVPF